MLGKSTYIFGSTVLHAVQYKISIIQSVIIAIKSLASIIYRTSWVQMLDNSVVTLFTINVTKSPSRKIPLPMTAVAAFAIILQLSKGALYNNVILRLTVRVLLYESIHLYTCEYYIVLPIPLSMSFLPKIVQYCTVSLIVETSAVCQLRHTFNIILYYTIQAL